MARDDNVIYTIRVEPCIIDEGLHGFRATVAEDGNLAEYSETIEGVLNLMAESLEVHFEISTALEQ